MARTQLRERSRGSRVRPSREGITPAWATRQAGLGGPVRHPDTGRAVSRRSGEFGGAHRGGRARLPGRAARDRSARRFGPNRWRRFGRPRRSPGNGQRRSSTSPSSRSTPVASTPPQSRSSPATGAATRSKACSPQTLWSKKMASGNHLSRRTIDANRVGLHDLDPDPQMLSQVLTFSEGSYGSDVTRIRDAIIQG